MSESIFNNAKNVSISYIFLGLIWQLFAYVLWIKKQKLAKIEKKLTS